jgi:hypothetical protein
LRQPPRAAPLFEFHSNFWVSLHQALFHEALLRAGKSDRRLQSSTPLSTPEMSESEKSAWNAAIDFYALRFQSRKELFDTGMVAINDRLATGPDDGTALPSTGLPAKLVSVLERAAPVYRKYWWPAHDRMNEA